MTSSSDPNSAQPRRRDVRPDPEDAREDTEESGENHLKSPRSLIRLRERVELAARELVRLREENAQLAARIRELESGEMAADSQAISFEEDPETLRRKVTGFIEAIDDYLGRESPRP